jgi:hypothetical protein
VCEAEPALRSVQLPGRNPEIQKQAVDSLDVPLIQDALDFTVIPVHQNDSPSKRSQSLAGSGQGLGIPVDSQNPALWPGILQYRFGMPPIAYCSVDDELFVPGV